jgi:hypothetical protein
VPVLMAGMEISFGLSGGTVYVATAWALGLTDDGADGDAWTPGEGFGSVCSDCTRKTIAMLASTSPNASNATAAMDCFGIDRRSLVITPS